MERVALSACGGYEVEALRGLLDRQFEALGVYDALKPGMLTVIKPNLIMKSAPEAAIITHPAVVAAVGLCVQKAGGRVLIAESPGGPYTPSVMKSIYKGCGYTEMAEQYGFSLYTDCKSREVSLPEGKRCRRMTVIEPFLDREFLIDAAKLKSHGMTGLSGAVKNLFGAVPGLMKPELHCRFPEKPVFSEMLVDLCDFLKPDLSVIDGVEAMEGDGPTGGQMRFVGALVSSRSPYAADVVAAELTGMVPEQVLMLKNAMERGLCPRNARELELWGDDLKSLCVPDFKKAKAASADFIDRLPGFLRPMARRLATPLPSIHRAGCIGCGKCAESCPQHTIAIQNGKAEIDYKNCIRCFCCHEMCPKHVVGVKRLGLFNW